MRKLILFIAFALGVGSLYAQPINQFQRIESSTIMQNSEYGRGVCINGDYAIVSALLDNHEGTVTAGGAAFIYHYENGGWNFQYKLVAEDADAKDHFGRSVFINDEHAIVGCTYSDDPDTYNGSAYIFVNNNDGTWTQQAKLLASDRRKLDRFGVSVGIDGDYAIIGCYGADYNDGGVDYLNAGAAYIYELDRETSSWGNEVIIHPNVPVAEEKFGWSVSILGNTALIGTDEDRFNDDDGLPGAAYVFQWSGGVWSQTQKLQPADILDGQNFGYSVDLTNGYAIVGAINDDDLGGDSGSAYIFRNNAGTFVQEQKITASNGASGDNFGFSVGIDGGQAVVGAWHSDKGNSDTGSAYIFTRDNNTGAWTQFSELIADDPGNSDQNGWFVSISGDFALTGAPRWDTDRSDLSIDQGTNEGTAYIFASAVVGDPKPSLTSTTPVSASNGVDVNQAIELVFDADIAFSDVGAQILIASSLDDTELARFDITGATTSSDLSISGGTLTINNLSFEFATEYYLQFIGEPILDLNGVAFDGLTASTGYVFTTEFTTPAWNNGYPVLMDQDTSSISINLDAVFTGDLNAGNYYVVLTSESGVSGQQVIDGQNANSELALWSGSGTITEASVETINIDISSLSSETSYYLSAVLENAGHLLSTVEALQFTTFDTNAPSYLNSYPSINNILGKEATLSVEVDEAASVFYVLTSNTAPNPSIEDVKNGIDGNAQAGLLSDSLGATANLVLDIPLSGLDYEVTYACYVVTKDLSSNYIETVSPTRLEFTTPSLSESVPVASFDPIDGSVDVPTTGPISISFNKPIYLASNPTEEVSTSSVANLISFKAINKGVTSPYDAPEPPVSDVAFTASYDASMYVISVVPNETLSEKHIYQLSIASVLDVDGNASLIDTSVFVTSDESAPVISYSSPGNGESNFNTGVHPSITIVFNEPIWTNDRHVYTSDLSGLLTFTDLSSSQGVSFEASIDSSYRLVQINPVERLDATTNYRIEMGVVSDSVGHTQTSPNVLDFQTANVNIWTGLGDLLNFTDNQNWVADFQPEAGAIFSTGTPVATVNSNVNLDYVIIESLASLIVNNGIVLTVDEDLLIESSEAGNGSFINNGTLSVDATKVVVEQVLPTQDQWYYISSPVIEEGSYTFDGVLDHFTGVNRASGEYYNYLFGDPVPAMDGLLVQGEGEFSFSGVLNNGELEVGIENNIDNHGWNFIGNPYPSAIDWDLISDEFKSDIENSFWLWLPSENTYGTYNGFLGIGTNLSGDASEIPSVQSFWVKSINAGIFTIDNSSLTPNDKSYYIPIIPVPPIASQKASLKSASAATANFPYVKFSGENGSNVDETVIAFVGDALSGLDKYDTEKRFGSNVNAIELFTIIEGSDFTINTFPSINESFSIGLGYRVQAEGNYTIRLAENIFSDEEYIVSLEDVDEGITTVMFTGSSYEFYSSVTKNTNRFVIHIEPITAIPTSINDNKDGISAIAVDNNIFINVSEVSDATYSIYDLSGHLISAGEIQDAITSVQVFAKGVYVVEVSNSSAKYTNKVVIK